MRNQHVPTGSDVFLDHVGAFVQDRDAAAATLSRLGFTQTPFAQHMNRQADGAAAPSGTGNRCVMFREGYLEILSATGEDTALARQFNAGLARYEGLHLIAFGVADVEACRENLIRQGLAPLPSVHLRRPVPTETGTSEGRFDVVRFPPETMPEGRIQVAAHQTPETVWQDRWLDHANGAEALSGILVVVEDVAETSKRFNALSMSDGTPRLVRGLVGVTIEDDAAQLIPNIVCPCLPFMAAVGVRCADLDQTEGYLKSQAVAYQRHAARLYIAPNDTLGMTVVFHGPETAPW